MKPIIIYGPQGSGKAEIEQAFRDRGIEVREEWCPGAELAPGEVVSTNAEPPYVGVDAVVLSFSVYA